jgi:hypothetical protein
MQVKEDLEDNKKTAKRDQNIQNTEIENLSKTLVRKMNFRSFFI